MLEIASSSEVTAKIGTSQKLILQLGAEWCGPCKMLKPKMENFSSLNANIQFAYVDIENSSEFARSMNVLSIPTVLAYHNGVLIDSQVGSSEKGVLNLIEKLNNL